MKITIKLLCIATLHLLSTSLAAQPQVTISEGTLEGSSLAGGGAVFKGIPFANPPLGELRWRDPQPVTPWPGVRQATQFGSPCIGNGEESSEDCLYINVWNAEWPVAAPKPVMLWIHGGGNFAGAASEPVFDGEALARQGVILVSANYRLGILGFFAHPALSQESPHGTSGNYGLLDQIAAMKWVKDNIASFGGDPNNVTIFGESAGSLDINVLLTSPLTAGLFQRLIGESGPALAVPTREAGEAKGVAVIETLGLGAAPDPLQAMRELTPEEIIAKTGQGLAFLGAELGIIQDGYVLPDPTLHTFAAGRQHKVDMILGSNARELLRPFFPMRNSLLEAVTEQYGPLSGRMLEVLGIADGQQPAPHPLHGDAMAQWATDTQFRCGSVHELIWHTRAGNKAWHFEFAQVAPGKEAVGAAHGSEMPYVFGNLLNTFNEVDAEVSRVMRTYWTNFAKTGNPNGSGLANWPEFDPEQRAYMEFNGQGPTVKEGLRRQACDLYMENIERLMN